MTILNPMRRPKGRVALFESIPSRGGWKRGKLLYERDNLFVNAGRPALASLLAGVTTGEFAIAVGYGSSNTAPALSDTGLTGTPKYYNAVGSSSFPVSGAVLFNYAIAVTDYGAKNLTVQEVGLFGNTATILLPSAVGTANASWVALNAYTPIGTLIVDSNSNIQRLTTTGTSGASPPVWATTVGTTTTDSGAIWTLVALHSVPVPMLAHAVVPSFTFTGAAAYQGTWTFTF